MTLDNVTEKEIEDAKDQIVVAAFGIMNLTYPYARCKNFFFPHFGIFETSPYSKLTPTIELLDAAAVVFSNLQGKYYDMCDFVQQRQKPLEGLSISEPQKYAADTKRATAKYRDST